MKRILAGLGIVLLVGIPLVLVTLYLLLDKWLESAGGREAIEKSLSAQTGMELRIAGGFEVDLWPALGVSGTDLQLWSAQGEAFQAENYQIQLALDPLLEGRIEVEGIELLGGRLIPEMWQPKPRETSGVQQKSGALPRVEKLIVQDLAILMMDQSWLLNELSIEGFQPGGYSPFRILFDDRIRLSGAFQLNLPAQPDRDRPGGGKLSFEELELDAMGQELEGTACVLLAERLSVIAQLRARQLDADRLVADFSSVFPASGEQEAGDGKGGAIWNRDLGVNLYLRLQVDELRSQGVLAENAVVEAGYPMSCKQESAGDL